MLPDGKAQRRIGFSATARHLPYQAHYLWCICALSDIGADWLTQADYDRLHAHLMYWHNNRMGREGCCAGCMLMKDLQIMVW